jgi:plasmid stability protein
MATLTVRILDDDVVRRLRIRAAEHGRSAEAEHRHIRPTPAADMDLHEVALEIGMQVNHSTYDTMYLAFAIAMGANGVLAF